MSDRHVQEDDRKGMDMEEMTLGERMDYAGRGDAEDRMTCVKIM